MQFALEEFLRAYAPVTMARLVAKDTDFHGCPMKKDDWVLLPFPAANRDPHAFEDPDKFIVDRQENRHAAFGLGIHRCIGSNLARLELKVAIEEFVKRFPRFELAGDGGVVLFLTRASTRSGSSSKEISLVWYIRVALPERAANFCITGSKKVCGQRSRCIGLCGSGGALEQGGEDSRPSS